MPKSRLAYGVDDLHGTIMREKIFHMAGVSTPEEQTVEALRHAIRAAGRDPVQRDSYYNHLPPRETGISKDCARSGRPTGLRLTWPHWLHGSWLCQISQRPPPDQRLERRRSTSIIHQFFAGNLQQENSTSRSFQVSNICATRSTRSSIASRSRPTGRSLASSSLFAGRSNNSGRSWSIRLRRRR